MIACVHFCDKQRIDVNVFVILGSAAAGIMLNGESNNAADATTTTTTTTTTMASTSSTVTSVSLMEMSTVNTTAAAATTTAQPTITTIPPPTTNSLDNEFPMMDEIVVSTLNATLPTRRQIMKMRMDKLIGRLERNLNRMKILNDRIALTFSRVAPRRSS